MGGWVKNLLARVLMNFCLSLGLDPTLTLRFAHVCQRANMSVAPALSCCYTLSALPCESVMRPMFCISASSVLVTLCYVIHIP